MKRILIIEPDAAMQEMYKSALADQPYEVCIATTGAEGYELYTQAETHLLFIELKLPDGDGVETMRKIREDGMDLMVAVVTGHAAEFLPDITMMQVDNLGFDVFHKPISEDQIRSIAGKTIGQ